MQDKTRQETIINYLRVKPSNHGEVETVLLAIPEREKLKSKISTDEWKLIEETFKEQGTNLIPIIVRRIEPDEQEHEYEVIYGHKWCIIAEELEIDRLWTWVFDLKDDEVPLIQQKMAALAESQALLELKQPSKTTDATTQASTPSKAIEINLEESLLNELNAGNIQINIEIKPSVKVQERQVIDPIDPPASGPYENLTVRELKSLAKQRGITGYSDKKKTELVKLHKDWDKNQNN